MAKKQIESQAKETPQPEKKIILTVKDRLLFGEFFPERSSLVNQMIAEDIGSKIKIDAAERKEINLRPQGQGGLVWDDKKEKPLEVSFSGVELDFLMAQVDRIEKLAQSGQGGFTVDTAKLARKIKALT